jgi:hypothetical protein
MLIDKGGKIMDKGIIICGFAGIGKSYFAKRTRSVDLESTPFNKNWEIYSNVAIHMSNNGYNVLLSCHKEIRDMLRSKEIKFITVMPDVNLKEEYIQRYMDRFNTIEFIKLMTENFEKFITEIKENEKNIVILKSNEYLIDVVLKLI